MRDGTTETRYKIRHVPTGQYSTGGMSPRKSSKGKVWKILAHILTHLGVLCNRGPDWYHDCVVEEYELTIKKVGEKPLSDMIKLKNDRDAAKQRAIHEQSRIEQENRERAKLERLRKKYGDP